MPIPTERIDPAQVAAAYDLTFMWVESAIYSVQNGEVMSEEEVDAVNRFTPLLENEVDALRLYAEGSQPPFGYKSCLAIRQLIEFVPVGRTSSVFGVQSAPLIIVVLRELAAGGTPLPDAMELLGRGQETLREFLRTERTI